MVFPGPLVGSTPTEQVVEEAPPATVTVSAPEAQHETFMLNMELSIVPVGQVPGESGWDPKASMCPVGQAGIAGGTPRTEAVEPRPRTPTTDRSAPMAGPPDTTRSPRTIVGSTHGDPNGTGSGGAREARSGGALPTRESPDREAPGGQRSGAFSCSRRGANLARMTTRSVSRSGSSRGTASAAAALLLAGCLGSCLAPPVMMPAPALSPERALAEYPPGTRLVELGGEGERTLRGVFVPAGEGAPVVLHLLGASQSPASLALPLDPATRDLVDLGFASLILDYGGVGTSGGEPDADALGDDALRMWREAVRLAGGRPERVLVRATSLGTIATALALRAGARPAAVMLVAPVFPGTVVRRFARDNYGVLAGWLAGVLYRPVARVDVLAELEASGAPLCAVLFEGDTWAGAGQRNALHELTAARTPHQWTVLPGDHMGGVVYAAALVEGELDFVASLQEPEPTPQRTLGELLDEVGPEARAAWAASPQAAPRLQRLSTRFRTVPAEHLLAAALEHDDVQEAGDLVRMLRVAAPKHSSFAQLRALYSTAGSPRGELIGAVLRFHSNGGDMLRRGTFEDLSGWDRASTIGENVGRLSRAAPRLERRMRAVNGSATARMTWDAADVAEATGSDEEFRLVIARAALKAAGIADRLVSDGQGRVRLEWLDGASWRPLGVGAPRRRASGAATGGTVEEGLPVVLG